MAAAPKMASAASAASVCIPALYVLRSGWSEAAWRPGTWAKVRLHDIADLERYRDGWELVRDFLQARPTS